MPSAPRRCPICEIPPRRAYRLHNRCYLLQCPRCRVAWWRWPSFDPAAFYDRDYFASERSPKGYADYPALAPAVRRTALSRLRRIECMLGGDGGSGRSLLDIGCATGGFPAAAAERGWRARGVEVSAWAAAQAREAGLDVRCAAIDTLPDDEPRYDCVTLWDVVEHLPDPFAAIRRAATLCRAGGVLALSTGDITSLCAALCGPRWHLFNLPEHLFFFSPHSLRLMLSRAGFRVRQIRREVNWSPVGYLVERVCKTCGVAPVASGRRAKRWLVPATLMDVLGVYAVRTPDETAADHAGRSSEPR